MQSFSRIPSSSSTMPSNCGMLIKKVQSQLECPICFDTCKPPIYLCRNGHSVCSNCQPQLRRCCLCRVKGKPTARCMQLEIIAELMASASQPDVRQVASGTDNVHHTITYHPLETPVYQRKYFWITMSVFVAAAVLWKRAPIILEETDIVKVTDIFIEKDILGELFEKLLLLQ